MRHAYPGLVAEMTFRKYASTRVPEPCLDLYHLTLQYAYVSTTRR